MCSHRLTMQDLRRLWQWRTQLFRWAMRGDVATMRGTQLLLRWTGLRLVVGCVAILGIVAPAGADIVYPGTPCAPPTYYRPVYMNPVDLGPYAMSFDVDMMEQSLIHGLALFNEHANAGFEFIYIGRTERKYAESGGELIVTFTSEPNGGQVAVTNIAGCNAAGVVVRLQNEQGEWIQAIPWTRERDNPGGGGTSWIDGTLGHELGHVTNLWHPVPGGGAGYCPALPDWDTISSFTADANEDSFLYDRDSDRLQSWNGITGRYSYYHISNDGTTWNWNPGPTSTISAPGYPPMYTSIAPAIADRFELQPSAIVAASVGTTVHLMEGTQWGFWGLPTNPGSNARRAVSVSAAPSGEIVTTWLDECQRCGSLTYPGGFCSYATNPPLFCRIGWAWSGNGGLSWTSGIIAVGNNGRGTNGRVSVDYDPAYDRFVMFFVDPNSDSVMSTYTDVSFPGWSAPALALDASTQSGIRNVCGSAFDGAGNGLFVGTNSESGDSPIACSWGYCGPTTPCINGVCDGADGAFDHDRIFAYEVQFDAPNSAYVFGDFGSIGPDYAGQDVALRSCGVAYNKGTDEVLIAFIDQREGELRLTIHDGLNSAYPDSWSKPFTIVDNVYGSVDLAYLSGADRWMVTFAY